MGGCPQITQITQMGIPGVKRGGLITPWVRIARRPRTFPADSRRPPITFLFFVNQSVVALNRWGNLQPFGPSPRRIVMAELNGALLQDATGRNWIRARRPDLYAALTVPTGMECDTRKLKFEE
jgi:hypothetical protein